MIKVLFVCMGNICRSPTAHGVFEQLVEKQGFVDKIRVDSAGTHAYHIGEAPDRRSTAVALGKGYDLSTQRARRVSVYDFDQFDYVIGMDAQNHQQLQHLATPEQRSKVHLMMSFAKGHTEAEVPDPYFGDDGFENVLAMIEEACDGLLQHIIANDISA